PPREVPSVLVVMSCALPTPSVGAASVPAEPLRGPQPGRRGPRVALVLLLGGRLRAAGQQPQLGLAARQRDRQPRRGAVGGQLGEGPLVIRSSREWYDSTAMRPPTASRSI